MKKYFGVFVFLSVICLFFSCSKEITGNEITGNWEFSKYTKTYTSSFSGDEVVEEPVYETVFFKADGTGTIVIYGVEDSMTWSITDNILILSYRNQTEEYTITDSNHDKMEWEGNWTGTDGIEYKVSASLSKQ